ncbi:MAG TPA: flagellar basal body P-ring formation chaperone FlgA [Gemmobacter sp.]|nr:flagellar basal body P-ring formation chaperone FlgA [Gemmobacter sp.]
MWRAVLLLAFAGPAAAETLVPSRTIRAQDIIAAEDLVVIARTTPGALSDPLEAIGQEARTTLYANRPIRPGDIGAPALIDRNQIVPLNYVTGGLRILTEGRALARGGVGDVIRVMNLSSRTTVSGRIAADGSVHVGLAP